MRKRVLVVDDDAGIREAIPMLLEDAGWECLTAENGEAALQVLGRESVSIVLSDLAMPKMDGRALLSQLTEHYPGLPMVMISAHGELETAVEAVRSGAYDYLVKPVDEERLTHTLERALEHSGLRRDYEAVRTVASSQTDLLGESEAMVRLRSEIDRAAPSDARILVLGENGTGKELVARELHEKSRRRERPFIKLNSAAIPGELIESELFGHEAGSFTGARKAKAGKLELAGSGTLFLDEIGDMSLETQAKLLRVLASGEYERVGGERILHFDARLVTATNHDLAMAVSDGDFREDLYHRVAVIPIQVPPLREREGDILLLADHFLAHYCGEYGRTPPEITQSAQQLMQTYRWPGNVRELRNMMERISIMHPSDQLESSDLEQLLTTPLAADNESAEAHGDLARFREANKEEERTLVQKTLEEHGWNVSQAARVLGIDRASLHRKIKRLGIRRPGTLEAES